MVQERHGEILRQWKVLHDIADGQARTLAELAGRHAVSTRTIRRDLDVLQMAGFPLVDERRDGVVHWRLSGTPFVGLASTGFSVAELCAFYVNRERLGATCGSALEDDLRSAVDKVGRALSPRVKAYLDRLRAVLDCKPDPPRRPDTQAERVAVDELISATLDHRRIEMDYHSFSSGKVKPYAIEPYRLTFGNGSLYLLAYVPTYGQMRTFAVHRIRRLRVLEETFDPVQEASGTPYGDSLGVFIGKAPERVEIEFAAKVAPYVEERQWHPSQVVTKQPDGSIFLTLEVACDLPLRTWILGFGHQARVISPKSLAETILEELEEAREQYAPRIKFEMPPAIFDEALTPRLPFPAARRRPGGQRTAASDRSRRQSGRPLARRP